MKCVCCVCSKRSVFVVFVVVVRKIISKKLNKMYFFSFNFFLILFLCYSQEDISPSSPSSPSKEITLSKWQYCVGCKATIEIFTTLATSKIVEMEQNGIASGEELDVAPLIKNLCDLAYFERFDPIIRYGCIKLLNDHKYDFLHSFEGDIASTSFSTSKSNIFSKSKQVSHFLFHLFHFISLIDLFKYC